MKDNAQTAAITTGARCATTTPINTKRPGAHRDRRAAAHRETTQPTCRTPGIAGGGTAITTGQGTCHTSFRAPD